jgi:hypothetical protein
MHIIAVLETMNDELFKIREIMVKEHSINPLSIKPGSWKMQPIRVNEIEYFVLVSKSFVAT